jgi:hypothetical protein
MFGIILELIPNQIFDCKLKTNPTLWTLMTLSYCFEYCMCFMFGVQRNVVWQFIYQCSH